MVGGYYSCGSLGSKWKGFLEIFGGVGAGIVCGKDNAEESISDIHLGDVNS